MKGLKIIALIAFLAIAAHAESQLTNVSTRGVVGTGDDVMIGGFIIGGTDPKTVLIRARGPVLTDFGVPGVLNDPVLQLFSGQTLIADNDDWETTTALCQNSGLNCGDAVGITATGLDPCVGNLTGCSREAAILVTLPPGPYTAIVRGFGGTTGVGLVEVFEVGEVPGVNIPDIRGTYTGTGSTTLRSCTDSSFNGTFSFNVTVSITDQANTEFRGTAQLTTQQGGVSFRQSFSFRSDTDNGMIDANGNVSGTFTWVFDEDEGFGFEETGRGNGSFSGALSGNTLTATTNTTDTSGGGCIGVGQLTVRR